MKRPIVYFLIGLFLILQASFSYADEIDLKNSDFIAWTIMSRSVLLYWTPVENSTGYQINVINPSTQQTVKTISVSSKWNRKKIVQLKPETEYIFKLCAKVAGSCDFTLFSAITITTKPVLYLADDFEQTTSGTISRGQIRYVAGKKGYGFQDVYKPNPEGGEIRANILEYDNTDGQLVDPEIGTVELWVKPTLDPAEDTETHGLFTAWSDSGRSNWDINVYQNQLIASRDYAPCIRDLLQTTYAFQRDQWTKIVLTWRGPVTRLFIDSQEVVGFQHKPRNVYDRDGEKVYVGDDLFVTDGLRISSNSSIQSDEMTLDFQESGQIQCPGIVELLEQNIDEEYKGIQLHDFPDSETRNEVKKLIDMLPSSYAQDIAHLVLVDDDRYELVYHTIANTSSYGRAIYFKKSAFDTPNEWKDKAKIFFHEAAHAHTYANELSYGGPRGTTKRQQWASISGIKTYVGECTSPSDFVISNGFLTAYGSTMADEDLAEWVGIAFDLYLKKSTFSALLDPSSDRYDKKHQRKIDFLLEKGFIDQTIYDAVTQTTLNTDEYLEFND